MAWRQHIANLWTTKSMTAVLLYHDAKIGIAEMHFIAISAKAEGHGQIQLVYEFHEHEVQICTSQSTIVC